MGKIDIRAHEESDITEVLETFSNRNSSAKSQKGK